MKHAHFLLALAGLTALAGAQPLPARENLHVYLLIGQSNMAGRAPFDAEESDAMDGVLLLNDKDEWEPATNPLNRYSTIRKGLGMQKMNPGYLFAKTMRARDPSTSIGLVVNAKGGTAVEQWVKGTEFYKEALRRARAAQASGTLAGILWHQGESNAKNPEGYQDKLAQLFQDLRQDLNAPDLPVVVGQVKDLPGINDQLAGLPKKLPHSACVMSEGLTTMDRWHFDAKSMRVMGERYAEEMIRLKAR